MKLMFKPLNWFEPSIPIKKYFLGWVIVWASAGLILAIAMWSEIVAGVTVYAH